MNKEIFMKKKLPIIIFGIIILYAVIFAVVLLETMYLPSSVYENPNLIIQDFNSANKINYRKSTQDGITTINCSKMTGMDTIWTYNTDEDATLQMYYTFQVTKGRAKLILINPDDTTITLVEQGGDTSGQTVGTNDDSDMTAAEEHMIVLDLKKGESRIKIVCEKGTAFSLSFKIPE